MFAFNYLFVNNYQNLNSTVPTLCNEFVGIEWDEGQHPSYIYSGFSSTAIKPMRRANTPVH